MMGGTTTGRTRIESSNLEKQMHARNLAIKRKSQSQGYLIAPSGRKRFFAAEPRTLLPTPPVHVTVAHCTFCKSDVESWKGLSEPHTDRDGFDCLGSLEPTVESPNAPGLEVRLDA